MLQQMIFGPEPAQTGQPQAEPPPQPQTQTN
jgi:hypothetical protein